MVINHLLNGMVLQVTAPKTAGWSGYQFSKISSHQQSLEQSQQNYKVGPYQL